MPIPSLDEIELEAAVNPLPPEAAPLSDADVANHVFDRLSKMTGDEIRKATRQRRDSEDIERLKTVLPQNALLRAGHVAMASLGGTIESGLARGLEAAGVERAAGVADQTNRQVQRYEQAAQEMDEDSVLPAWLARGLRGAATSTATMLPASALAGPVGAILTASAQEANQAVTEAKDAGLTGADAAGYVVRRAAIEALPAMVFERMGFSGAEGLLRSRALVDRSIMAGIKSALPEIAAENVEELATNIGHALHDAWSEVDPEAATPESLAQTAFDTAVATTIMMTGGKAVKHVADLMKPDPLNLPSSPFVPAPSAQAAPPVQPETSTPSAATIPPVAPANTSASPPVVQAATGVDYSTLDEKALRNASVDEALNKRKPLYQQDASFARSVDQRIALIENELQTRFPPPVEMSPDKIAEWAKANPAAAQALAQAGPGRNSFVKAGIPIGAKETRRVAHLELIKALAGQAPVAPVSTPGLANPPIAVPEGATPIERKIVPVENMAQMGGAMGGGIVDNMYEAIYQYASGQKPNLPAGNAERFAKWLFDSGVTDETRVIAAVKEFAKRTDAGEKSSVVAEDIRAKNASKSAPIERKAEPVVEPTAEAAPPASKPEAKSVDLSKAVTGQPFSFTGFRGSGKDASEVYTGTQYPIAGQGLYVASSEVDAKGYGDNLTQHPVTLTNPLVIRSDDEWRTLSKSAGNRYANYVETGDDEVKASAERIKARVLAMGHDGLIIDNSMRDDVETKTLERLFGHPQVISYATPKTEPTASAAPEEKPPARFKRPWFLGGVKYKVSNKTAKGASYKTELAFASDLDHALFSFPRKMTENQRKELGGYLRQELGADMSDPEILAMAKQFRTEAIAEAKKAKRGKVAKIPAFKTADALAIVNRELTKKGISVSDGKRLTDADVASVFGLDGEAVDESPIETPALAVAPEDAKLPDVVRKQEMKLDVGGRLYDLRFTLDEDKAMFALTESPRRKPIDPQLTAYLNAKFPNNSEEGLRTIAAATRARIQAQAKTQKNGGTLTVEPFLGGRYKAPDAAPMRAVDLGEMISAVTDGKQIANVVTGNATTVHAPGMAPMNARYALIERGDAHPSHLPVPEKGGSPVVNKAFADKAGVQPRNLDASEMDLRLQTQRQHVPGYFVNDAASALDGPPVVLSSGGAVAGSGRLLGILDGYMQKDSDWYTGELAKKATNFGFSPDDLARFKQPVLVRILDDNQPFTQAILLGDRSNVPTTQGMSPLRRAAGMVDLLPDSILAHLNLTGHEDMSTIWSRQTPQVESLRLAVNKVVGADRATYIDKHGNLTQAGSDLVKNMLLLKVIPSVELIEKLPPKVRDSMLNSIPAFLAAKPVRQWQLTKPLMEALEFYVSDVFELGTKRSDGSIADATLPDALQETNMPGFPVSVTVSPEAAQLLDLFISLNWSSAKIRDAVSKTANEMSTNGANLINGSERSAGDALADFSDLKPRGAWPESADPVWLQKVVTEGQNPDTVEYVGSMAGDVVNRVLEYFGLPTAQPKPSPLVVPTPTQTPGAHHDPQVEARLRDAHGAPETEKTTLTEKVQQIWAKVTRHSEFLPSTPAFDHWREWFRLLPEIPRVAEERTIRSIAKIVSKFDEGKKLVFERYLIVGNLLENLDRNFSGRMGLNSRQALEDYRAELQRYVDANPDIQEALAMRAQLHDEILDQLVDRGVLDDSAKARKSYFHQQVLGFIEGRDNGRVAQIAAQLRDPSFTFNRSENDLSDPRFDFNTDYVEAEFAWMADALTRIGMEEHLDTIRQDDLQPGLERRAKDENRFVALARHQLGKTAVVSRAELVKLGGEIATEIEELSALIQEMVDNGEDAKDIALVRERRRELDPTMAAKSLMARASAEAARKFGRELSPNEIAKLSEDPVHGRIGRMWLKGKAQRDAILSELTGADAVSWEQLLPETHRAYVIEPGNVFHREWTLPQQIVSQLQQAGAQGLEMRLSADELREVKVMSAPAAPMVLPNEVVDQLEKGSVGHSDGFLGELALWRDMMRGIKFMLLHAPWKLLPFRARNLFGDADAMLGGGQLGATKYAREAAKELGDYIWRPTQGVSADFEAALKYNVIGSGYEAQEGPDIRKLEGFRKLYPLGAKHPPDNFAMRAGARMMDMFDRHYLTPVRNASLYSEGALRYAVFKDVLAKVRAGRMVDVNFGGTNEREARAVLKRFGPEAFAAKISRETMGDYGNRTVMTNWLRTYVAPFASFQEINLQRYPRFVMNGYNWAKLKGKDSVAARAAYAGLAVSGLAAMTGMAVAWNIMVFPDEYKELSDYDRATAGIILGKTQDGMIKYFRNVTSLGAFMEPFGMNTVVKLMPKYRSGQLTGDDIVHEMLKDSVNWAASTIGPQLKAPAEAVAGLSTYPDIFNPRRMARDEILANAIGIRDMYREVAGRLNDDGRRARPHAFAKSFYSVVDPRNAALSELYELRDAFLTKKGHPRSEMIAPASPIANMRDAAARGDMGAFIEARDAYIHNDGAKPRNLTNFNASLNSVDPIQKLNAADEKEFETEFLSGNQRSKYDMARGYAQTLQQDMWLMWQRAEALTPSMEYGETMERMVFNKAEALARSDPGFADRAKRDRFDNEQADAIHWLSVRQISPSDAASIYLKHKQGDKARGFNRIILNYKP